MSSIAARKGLPKKGILLERASFCVLKMESSVVGDMKDCLKQYLEYAEVGV